MKLQTGSYKSDVDYTSIQKVPSITTKTRTIMTQIKYMQIYSTLNTFQCKMYTNKKNSYFDFLIGILERYQGHVNS